MIERFAVLCPGQGGQHAAMFDLVKTDPRGEEVLQEYALDQRLNCSLTTLLHKDELLFANRYAQALIVAAGLAAWEIIRDDLPAPGLTAGYSVGELTAYGVAGAWSAATAIDTAVARAHTMDACLQENPAQGLMSVSGLAVEHSAQILAQHHAYIAIKTGFDTAIAGGCSDDLKAAQQHLQQAGARCGVLPVGIASHTPLMQSAVATLRDKLDQVELYDPLTPVLAGVSGQVVLHHEQAKTALVQQLTHTIDWVACMDACAERGIKVVLELGPGAALTRMLRERHPHIEARSVMDFRSLIGVQKWLHSRFD